MLKKSLVAAGVLLLGVTVYAYSFARDIGAIASGYVAQSVCTNVLVVGRDQAEFVAQGGNQVSEHMR